ncbi:MAG: hypothetical protein QXN37_04445 [Candidatus Anstonellaceae archaeon]
MAVKLSEARKAFAEKTICASIHGPIKFVSTVALKDKEYLVGGASSHEITKVFGLAFGKVSLEKPQLSQNGLFVLKFNHGNFVSYRTFYRLKANEKRQVLKELQSIYNFPEF